MTGGDDNDIFLIRRAAEHGNGETILGSQGTDRIRFTSTTAGETLVLSALVEEIEVVEITSATGSAAGTTALSLDASSVGASLELRGNAGNNRLTGTAFGDVIYGNGGSDDLRGGGGSRLPIRRRWCRYSKLLGFRHGRGRQPHDRRRVEPAMRESDTLSSIENLTGSGFADTLVGDGAVQPPRRRRKCRYAPPAAAAPMC